MATENEEVIGLAELASVGIVNKQSIEKVEEFLDKMWLEELPEYQRVKIKEDLQPFFDVYYKHCLQTDEPISRIRRFLSIFSCSKVFDLISDHDEFAKVRSLSPYLFFHMMGYPHDMMCSTGEEKFQSLMNEVLDKYENLDSLCVYIRSENSTRIKKFFEHARECMFFDKRDDLEEDVDSINQDKLVEFPAGDLFMSAIEGRVTLFCRSEYRSILSNQRNPWTGVQLENTTISNIRNRDECAKRLGLPVAEILEDLIEKYIMSRVPFPDTRISKTVDSKTDSVKSNSHSLQYEAYRNSRWGGFEAWVEHDIYYYDNNYYYDTRAMTGWTGAQDPIHSEGVSTSVVGLSDLPSHQDLD